MSPASGPVQEPKMFPAALLEDQEAVMNQSMEPVVFGPPPFSSDDPMTDGRRLVPLSDVEAADKAAADAVPDEDKKATDWKSAVDAAQTQEELDDVADRYSESGKDFSTVDDAIEKKQEELNAQSEEQPEEENA